MSEMKTWRPENWDEILELLLDKYTEEYEDVLSLTNLLNGVADAMLEALKATGVFGKLNNAMIVHHSRGCLSLNAKYYGEIGTLVFIPDEEDNDVSQA